MMTQPMPQDQQGQSSVERLVMLSKRDVEDASRLLKMLVDGPPPEAAKPGGPPPEAAKPGGPPEPVTREALIEAARSELKRRSRRSKLLPEAMFGEPAWEILLLLYLEQRGARLTIARLTNGVGIAPTTVLRWLSFLQDRQLVVREDHPTDQRSFFVELTENAIEALDIYLSEKLAQGA